MPLLVGGNQKEACGEGGVVGYTSTRAGRRGGGGLLVAFQLDGGGAHLGLFCLLLLVLVS